MKNWHVKWYLLLIIVLAFSFIYALAPQQEKSYDYVLVLTVENITADEGAKLNDEIYKLQEKYKDKFKIELYQKKDFDKRMNLPDLKVKFR